MEERELGEVEEEGEQVKNEGKEEEDVMKEKEQHGSCLVVIRPDGSSLLLRAEVSPALKYLVFQKCMKSVFLII